MQLSGRTAVVTGGASGIGRAVAVSLARRGCNLALVDINEAGLAETCERVRSAGVRVTCHKIDVADRAAVAALPEQVTARHANVSVVVNNAGVALGGTFEQVSETDFEWLFETNFWGVVRMTRAFLPLLRTSDLASIVNLSSVFGLVAPADQVAYSASKFAIRGFSEALRHELTNTTVRVTVVHPGGVRTAIAENARMPQGADAAEAKRRAMEFAKGLRLPPERAGEIIVRGIERRKARVLVGADAVALSLLARILPVRYWALLRLGLPT
jgi:short-subunit dehydrogenase